MQKTKVLLLRFFALLFFVGGGVAVGFGAYNFIQTGVEVNLVMNISLVAGGVLLILVTFVFTHFAKNIKSKMCLKCGSSLDGCAYEWVLLSLNLKRSRDESFAGQVATYEVTAQCPHCGKERKYRQEYLAADLVDGSQNNTQKMIEDWCKEKFGH